MKNKIISEMLIYSDNPTVNKPEIERVFNDIMDRLDIPRKKIICVGSLNEWNEYRIKTPGKFKASRDTCWDYLLNCGWFAVLHCFDNELNECSDRKKYKHSKSCLEMLLIFGQCCSAKVEKIYWSERLLSFDDDDWQYYGEDWIRYPYKYILRKKNRSSKQKFQDIYDDLQRGLGMRSKSVNAKPLKPYERIMLHCGIKGSWHAEELLNGFVDAGKNGLLGFWMYKDCIVYVVKPKVCMNKDGYLHNKAKAAVTWANGEKYWYLNGVKVTQEIVETLAEKLDPKIILTEKNVEVRREIVRKIGMERICQKLNAYVIDKSDNGMYELLMLDTGDKKRPYLKMSNPSIGTYHVEGVRRRCRTVAQALAFRMKRVTHKGKRVIISENGQDWYQQGDVIVYPKGAMVLKPVPVILT